MQSERFDAIVLGAGGAGLMCAATAGQRGRRVLLVDHNRAPGNKILISGGGRCNFTNVGARPETYVSANPRFAASALARYTPEDFVALVDRYRIAWHEKTLGQLFCDGSAKQIVAMLLDECAAGHVDLQLGSPINEVDHADGVHRVRAGGREAHAPALVIATGGPSIPKLGATGFAYELAKRFGLKLVQPRPALVPLTLGPAEALFRELSGVATEVQATAGGVGFREAALFTHKGLSGPAILQASSYWQPGAAVSIDFTPAREPGWLAAAKRARPKAQLRSALGAALPDRLAEALGQRLALPGELGHMPDRALADAERRLASWVFTPTGTEGYAKAEVAAGGISTDGLNQKTMEARRVPGLYAIGEAVDVTGWLGGYNFQWAWASGVAAGDVL